MITAAAIDRLVHQRLIIENIRSDRLQTPQNTLKPTAEATASDASS